MPFCTKCGIENPPGAHFCGDCGTALQRDRGVCAHCGKRLEPKEKFCSDCGTPLTREEAPPVTPPVRPGKKKGCMARIFRIFALFLALLAAIVLVLYFLPDFLPEGGGLTNTNIPGIVDIEPGDVSHLPENRDQTNEQVPAMPITEEQALKETAKSVEQAFENADTTQFKQVLTASALKTYSGIMKEIQPHMHQYAKAFKNRKLISSTGVFKVYEFRDSEGNRFTAEFALQPEGNWKLIRF